MRFPIFATGAILLVLQLASFVHGHSWLDCVNVTNPNSATFLGNMQCNAYERGYVGRSNPDANMWKVEGMTYDRWVNYPCCKFNSPQYSAQYPMMRSKAGNTMTIAYTPNGHTMWHKPPPPNGPRDFFIKWTGVAGQQLTTMGQLAGAKTLYQTQFDTPCHNRRTGAQLDSSSGLCMADIKIPDNLAPGVYQMVWYWPFRFAGSNVIEDYTSCWDVEITGSNVGAGTSSTSSSSSSTSSTSSTSTSGTRTTTSSTSSSATSAGMTSTSGTATSTSGGSTSGASCASTVNTINSGTEYRVTSILSNQRYEHVVQQFTGNSGLVENFITKTTANSTHQVREVFKQRITALVEFMDSGVTGYDNNDQRVNYGTFTDSWGAFSAVNTNQFMARSNNFQLNGAINPASCANPTSVDMTFSLRNAARGSGSKMALEIRYNYFQYVTVNGQAIRSDLTGRDVTGDIQAIFGMQTRTVSTSSGNTINAIASGYTERAAGNAEKVYMQYVTLDTTDVTQTFNNVKLVA